MHLQSLTQSSSGINHVDLTTDGEWLLTVDNAGVAFIYSFNTATRIFDSFQNISASAISVAAPTITDDHLWLYFPKDTGFFDVYYNSGQSFALKESLPEFQNLISFNTPDYMNVGIGAGNRNIYVQVNNGTNSSELQKMTMTKATQRLVVTRHGKTYVYSSYTYNTAVLEVLVNGIITHQVTDNEKYLVNFYNQAINVYMDTSFTACTIPYCMECNSTNCVLCSGIFGYYVNETTGQCGGCAVSNCLACSVTTSACATCDSSNNYLLNSSSSSCQLCQLEGCTSCSSFTTCTQCNTASNYFLDSSTQQCVLCSITGCQECSAIDTCNVCQDGYWLDGSPQICITFVQTWVFPIIIVIAVLLVSILGNL